MKLPQVIDADDVGIIAKGVILYALAVLALLGFAAALGLAWVVFQTAGGLSCC